MNKEDQLKYMKILFPDLKPYQEVILENFSKKFEQKDLAPDERKKLDENFKGFHVDSIIIDEL